MGKTREYNPPTTLIVPYIQPSGRPVQPRTSGDGDFEGKIISKQIRSIFGSINVIIAPELMSTDTPPPWCAPVESA